jgi:lipid II:glycine glycyltransferase (peptidoglycan interpeptide bridge formation enzyme)
MATLKTSAVSSNQQLLQQELSQLRHQLRRVRDGLERNPSHELERRAKQLSDNIALCERELKQNPGQKRDDPKAQSYDV